MAGYVVLNTAGGTPPQRTLQNAFGPPGKDEGVVIWGPEKANDYTATKAVRIGRFEDFPLALDPVKIIEIHHGMHTKAGVLDNAQKIQANGKTWVEKLQHAKRMPIMNPYLKRMDYSNLQGFFGHLMRLGGAYTILSSLKEAEGQAKLAHAYWAGEEKQRFIDAEKFRDADYKLTYERYMAADGTGGRLFGANSLLFQKPRELGADGIASTPMDLLFHKTSWSSNPFLRAYFGGRGTKFNPNAVDKHRFEAVTSRLGPNQQRNTAITEWCERLNERRNAGEDIYKDLSTDNGAWNTTNYVRPNAYGEEPSMPNFKVAKFLLNGYITTKLCTIGFTTLMGMFGRLPGPRSASGAISMQSSSGKFMHAAPWVSQHGGQTAFITASKTYVQQHDAWNNGKDLWAGAGEFASKIGSAISKWFGDENAEKESTTFIISGVKTTGKGTKPGSGYHVGDSVSFSTSGYEPVTEAEGKVSNVDDAGGIAGIVITKSGSGYLKKPLPKVSVTGGTGFQGIVEQYGAEGLMLRQYNRICVSALFENYKALKISVKDFREIASHKLVDGLKENPKLARARQVRKDGSKAEFHNVNTGLPTKQTFKEGDVLFITEPGGDGNVRKRTHWWVVMEDSSLPIDREPDSTQFTKKGMTGRGIKSVLNVKVRYVATWYVLNTKLSGKHTLQTQDIGSQDYAYMDYLAYVEKQLYVHMLRMAQCLSDGFSPESINKETGKIRGAQVTDSGVQLHPLVNPVLGFDGSLAGVIVGCGGSGFSEAGPANVTYKVSSGGVKQLAPEGGYQVFFNHKSKKKFKLKMTGKVGKKLPNGTFGLDESKAKGRMSSATEVEFLEEHPLGSGAYRKPPVPKKFEPVYFLVPPVLEMGWAAPAVDAESPTVKPPVFDPIKIMDDNVMTFDPNLKTADTNAKREEEIRLVRAASKNLLEPWGTLYDGWTAFAQDAVWNQLMGGQISVIEPKNNVVGSHDAGFGSLRKDICKILMVMCDATADCAKSIQDPKMRAVQTITADEKMRIQGMSTYMPNFGVCKDVDIKTVSKNLSEEFYRNGAAYKLANASREAAMTMCNKKPCGAVHAYATVPPIGLSQGEFKTDDGTDRIGEKDTALPICGNAEITWKFFPTYNSKMVNPNKSGQGGTEKWLFMWGTKLQLGSECKPLMHAAFTGANPAAKFKHRSPYLKASTHHQAHWNVIAGIKEGGDFIVETVLNILGIWPWGKEIVDTNKFKHWATGDISLPQVWGGWKEGLETKNHNEWQNKVGGGLSSMIKEIPAVGDLGASQLNLFMTYLSEGYMSTPNFYHIPRSPINLKVEYKMNKILKYLLMARCVYEHERFVRCGWAPWMSDVVTPDGSGKGWEDEATLDANAIPAYHFRHQISIFRGFFNELRGDDNIHPSWKTLVEPNGAGPNFWNNRHNIPKNTATGNIALAHWPVVKKKISENLPMVPRPAQSALEAMMDSKAQPLEVTRKLSGVCFPLLISSGLQWQSTVVPASGEMPDDFEVWAMQRETEGVDIPGRRNTRGASEGHSAFDGDIPLRIQESNGDTRNVSKVIHKDDHGWPRDIKETQKKLGLPERLLKNKFYIKEYQEISYYEEQFGPQLERKPLENLYNNSCGIVHSDALETDSTQQNPNTPPGPWVYTAPGDSSMRSRYAPNQQGDGPNAWAEKGKNQVPSVDLRYTFPGRGEWADIAAALDDKMGLMANAFPKYYVDDLINHYFESEKDGDVTQHDHELYKVGTVARNGGGQMSEGRDGIVDLHKFYEEYIKGDAGSAEKGYKWQEAKLGNNKQKYWSCWDYAYQESIKGNGWIQGTGFSKAEAEASISGQYGMYLELINKFHVTGETLHHAVDEDIEKTLTTGGYSGDGHGGGGTYPDGGGEKITHRKPGTDDFIDFKGLVGSGYGCTNAQAKAAATKHLDVLVSQYVENIYGVEINGVKRVDSLCKDCCYDANGVKTAHATEAECTTNGGTWSDCTFVESGQFFKNGANDPTWTHNLFPESNKCHAEAEADGDCKYTPKQPWALALGQAGCLKDPENPNVNGCLTSWALQINYGLGCGANGWDGRFGHGPPYSEDLGSLLTTTEAKQKAHDDLISKLGNKNDDKCGIDFSGALIVGAVDPNMEMQESMNDPNFRYAYDIAAIGVGFDDGGVDLKWSSPMVDGSFATNPNRTNPFWVKGINFGEWATRPDETNNPNPGTKYLTDKTWLNKTNFEEIVCMDSPLMRGDGTYGTAAEPARNVAVKEAAEAVWAEFIGPNNPNWEFYYGQAEQPGAGCLGGVWRDKDVYGEERCCSVTGEPIPFSEEVQAYGIDIGTYGGFAGFETDSGDQEEFDEWFHDWIDVTINTSNGNDTDGPFWADNLDASGDPIKIWTPASQTHPFGADPSGDNEYHDYGWRYNEGEGDGSNASPYRGHARDYLHQKYSYDKTHFDKWGLGQDMPGGPEGYGFTGCPCECTLWEIRNAGLDAAIEGFKAAISQDSLGGGGQGLSHGAPHVTTGHFVKEEDTNGILNNEWRDCSVMDWEPSETVGLHRDWIYALRLDDNENGKLELDTYSSLMTRWDCANPERIHDKHHKSDFPTYFANAAPNNNCAGNTDGCYVSELCDGSAPDASQGPWLNDLKLEGHNTPDYAKNANEEFLTDPCGGGLPIDCGKTQVSPWPRKPGATVAYKGLGESIANGGFGMRNATEPGYRCYVRPIECPALGGNNQDQPYNLMEVIVSGQAFSAQGVPFEQTINGAINSESGEADEKFKRFGIISQTYWVTMSPWGIDEGEVMTEWQGYKIPVTGNNWALEQLSNEPNTSTEMKLALVSGHGKCHYDRHTGEVELYRLKYSGLMYASGVTPWITGITDWTNRGTIAYYTEDADGTPVPNDDGKNRHKRGAIGGRNFEQTYWVNYGDDARAVELELRDVGKKPIPFRAVEGVAEIENQPGGKIPTQQAEAEAYGGDIKIGLSSESELMVRYNTPWMDSPDAKHPTSKLTNRSALDAGKENPGIAGKSFGDRMFMGGWPLVNPAYPSSMYEAKSVGAPGSLKDAPENVSAQYSINYGRKVIILDVDGPKDRWNGNFNKAAAERKRTMGKTKSAQLFGKSANKLDIKRYKIIIDKETFSGSGRKTHTGISQVVHDENWFNELVMSMQSQGNVVLLKYGTTNTSGGGDTCTFKEGSGDKKINCVYALIKGDLATCEHCLAEELDPNKITDYSKMAQSQSMHSPVSPAARAIVGNEIFGKSIFFEEEFMIGQKIKWEIYSGNYHFEVPFCVKETHMENPFPEAGGEKNGVMQAWQNYIIPQKGLYDQRLSRTGYFLAANTPNSAWPAAIPCAGYSEHRRIIDYQMVNDREWQEIPAGGSMEVVNWTQQPSPLWAGPKSRVDYTAKSDSLTVVLNDTQGTGVGIWPLVEFEGVKCWNFTEDRETNKNDVSVSPKKATVGSGPGGNELAGTDPIQIPYQRGDSIWAQSSAGVYRIEGTVELWVPANKKLIIKVNKVTGANGVEVTTDDITIVGDWAFNTYEDQYINEYDKIGSERNPDLGKYYTAYGEGIPGVGKGEHLKLNYKAEMLFYKKREFWIDAQPGFPTMSVDHDNPPRAVGE